MADLHGCARWPAWVHRGCEVHHPFVRLAGKCDETVDSPPQFGNGQPNVLQCASVEIVKHANGGPTAEIARDPSQSGAEQPRK